MSILSPMANLEPKTVRKMRVRSLVIGGIVFIAVLCAGLYLRSDRFQERVRLKVVNELEKATGGEVELRSFTWNISKLEFEGRDLIIRGLEPRTEKPYARVDVLKVRLKIISLFEKEIGLREVYAERPMVHIIVNKDGTTNQPTPKVVRAGQGNPVDLLFQLAIDRLHISDGELQWNDRKVPLDIDAEDVSVEMTYALAEQRYNGLISVGGSMIRLQQLRPLPSNAELRFSLHKKGADIQSLRWSSPASRLEASGRVLDLNDPVLELTYKAQLSVAELGSTANIAEARGGTAVLEGSAKYSAKGYSSAGRVVMKDIDWRDRSLRLENANAAAQFKLDQDRLELGNIVGTLLGGNVRGSAQIANWTNPTQREPLQRGKAQFLVNGLPVAKIAEALSTESFPLASLNPAGAASGKVNLQWTGPISNVVAGLDLKVTPPTNAREGTLPMEAELRGTYYAATESLKVDALELVTPSSRISAKGALGSESAQVQVNAEISSLSELEPFLAAADQGGKLPIELKGKARFNGTMGGRLKAPTVRGQLEVQDFFTVLAAPAEPVAGMQKVTTPGAAVPGKVNRVHWDSLSAYVDYSPTQLSVQRGTLQRGSAIINFSGKSALTRGRFTETNAFQLQADVRNASVADVQSIAGTNYDASGTVNAKVNVSGTMKQMNGGGTVRVENGQVYGEPFKSLRAELKMTGPEVQATDLVFAQNGATLRGKGAYNLTAKSFRFEAEAQNVDLAHLKTAQLGKVKFGGKGFFKANGSGTLEAPAINAHLEFKELTMNGQAAGDLVADATTKGRELQLNARSTFNNADLLAQGSIALRGDFPGQVTVTFNGFRFDPFLQPYIENRVAAKLSASGTIRLSGPMKQPKQLVIEGDFDRFLAELQQMQLTNEGPIKFSLRNQVFTLNQMHIRGEGTDLTASGTASLAGDQRLDMKAEGSINLKAFEGFNQDLMSYGTTTMQLTVRGTMKRPDLSGNVSIADAGVSFIDLPNGLSDINGNFIFNENRLQIQSLTARSGGGKLDVGGFITYRNGLYFDLTARGKDVRLRYPPGISSAADADLRYTGTTRSSLLSGEILVTRFGLNPRFDFALYLARSKQPPTVPKANPIFDNLRLDVRVTSTPELRVETSLAKISGDVDLRLRGTASRPAVLGKVNIVEGDIFFNATKYKLERGDITFTNPVRIEPIMNIEASARVREYDITLGFHGSIDKLGTTYRSEPPLPTADIIALLALGRTREDAALNQQPTQSFSETASNAILGQALNAAVSNRIQKLFGVSRIKIDPQVGGPENNPNARLTIEQQVNNNITLTYITNLSQSAQQIIQAEFNVNRNVSIVVVRDQNGVLGFDVRVRQRKK